MTTPLETIQAWERHVKSEVGHARQVDMVQARQVDDPPRCVDDEDSILDLECAQYLEPYSILFSFL